LYKIEKKEFGFWLTFGGMIYVEEAKEWATNFENDLKSFPDGFHVFVDMRTLKPLDKETQEFMSQGQIAAKDYGMIRSVVILSNPVTTLQFKRIAQKTGIYEYERYIDASTDPNWEQTGLDWLLEEKDPEDKIISIQKTES